MKELNPTNLIAILVPNEARSFWLHLNMVCFKMPKGFDSISFGEVHSREQMMSSIDATCKILGTVTKEIKADFDFRKESFPQTPQSLLKSNNIEITEGKKLLILKRKK